MTVTCDIVNCYAHNNSPHTQHERKKVSISAVTLRLRQNCHYLAFSNWRKPHYLVKNVLLTVLPYHFLNLTWKHVAKEPRHEGVSLAGLCLAVGGVLSRQ